MDISTVTSNSGSDRLSLILLPESKNGVGYSKSDVELVITLAKPSPPEEALEEPTVNPVETPLKEYPKKGEAIGPFQLMMWFDKQFKWQKTTEQRSWCVTCGRSGGSKKRKQKKKRKGSSSSCKHGDSIRITECDDDSEGQLWKWKDGHIMTHTDNDLCWDYDAGDYFELRKCGESDYQRFRSGPAPNGFNTNGNLEANKFELYPHEKRISCVTQRHHPRGNEHLKSLPCDRARQHDTSYWIAASPPNLNGHSLESGE